MDFIKHPILVIPFLKCCTYIKNQEYKIVTKNCQDKSVGYE